MAESKGATTANRLPVSGAFHTKYMLSAKDKLNSVLKDIAINEPGCMVYSNKTGKPYKSAKEIKDYLADQIINPVMWDQIITDISKDNYDEYREIGVGNSLFSMFRQTNKDMSKFNFNKDYSTELPWTKKEWTDKISDEWRQTWSSTYKNE